MKSLLRLGLAGLLCAGLLSAQEFRATISGYVYDSSGAAVPNAKIEAVNLANKETTTATSDASGAYTLPFLTPGDYRVTAAASGFKQSVRDKVNLEVGRIVGINITLEVGQLSESVTVSAEAALLETQTASRVGVINTTQVSELPLNSRNPFMLGSMMSGVNFRGAAIWQRPFDNGAIAEWSVNGGRQSNNEFLMDGAPNNAQMGSNNIAYVPVVDAVQEFSVQQNSYDAQYGKTGGGVFNVILKSGTSQFHGVAWEFARRKFLDANTFQNNSVGSPRPGHKLDQYGFQVDGPIYFPKLLKKDGAVRLFYSGTFENYRELWPQFLRNSYPEPEMRNGDFSKLVTAQGQPITIYDPIPVGFDANNNPIRQPFPGNIIPQNRIHPIARAVTQYMPLPNATTPGQRYANQNLLNPEYPAHDKFYNLSLKFDWQFGDKNRAFFRHASNDRTEDRCVNGICEGPGMDGQQPFQRINDAYVLDWLTTINPTTILNIRASSNRFIETGFGRGNTDFDLVGLGISPSLLAQLPQPINFGRWNISGYSSLGRARDRNVTNSYNLATNVTKIVNSHTMKMGLDIRRMHWAQMNTGNVLQFDAQTQWTQRIWNQGEATAGDAYASFLLGGIGGSSNYPLFSFFRQWYVAPYFQDDWKVSRRLTVNLGFRWDLNMYPDEKYNRLNRGFNAQATSPVAAQIPANMLALYPQFRDLKGGLEFAGVNGNDTKVGEMDWNNFQPRVGVAFSANDKTVIRGGYGLFYTNFANNNDWNRSTGFATSTPLVNSPDGGRTLISNLLSNPFPTGVNQPVGSSLGYNTFVGQNFTWFNPNMVVPKVHQFSFGVQRSITQNSTLDLSYVGSRSVNLSNERPFNLPSAEFRKQCNLLEGGNPNFCNEQIANPFQGIEAFRGTNHFSNATLRRYDLMRPFPQFSGDLLEQGRNDSKIWYNSLQVNYNMRVGRSLTLLGNYTFSKMVERWGWLDAQNNIPQQGLYFSDRPHFFKFSTVYQLPFGKGQKFANDTGWVDKIIGGWQVSTFTQMSSGEPNDLPGNAILLRDPRTPGGDFNGDVDWKAHQVRGWNPCVLRQFNDGSVVPQPFSLARGCGTDTSNYAWLMTADFSPQRYNPSRSGQIRKQRMFNTDISLAKDTYITERVRVQLRVEAFNATNYYFFGRNDGFNTDPNNPNFGSMFPNQANTQNGYPRQIQLGIKAYW